VVYIIVFGGPDLMKTYKLYLALTDEERREVSA
jgi:hypothetical protein